MWRAIRWVWVIGLSCAISGTAGAESTDARRIQARTTLEQASRPQQAGQDSEAIETPGQHGRTDSFQRALALQEATLGSHHPDVARSYNEVAQLRLAQGDLDEAVTFFWRAFTLSEERLRQETLGLSESRLMGFLQALRADEERIYALAHAHLEDARVRRLAMASVLLRKGRSIEETANTSRAIYRDLGPQDRELFEKLRDLRTELATLSLQGPGSLSATTYRQRIKELAAQGDRLEADLSRRSAALRASTALPSPAVIVDRVAAALPRDSALIEYVAYVDRPLSSRPGTPGDPNPGQLRYLALVLFPDAHIQGVDLGPAARIDSAATALLNAFADKNAAYQAQSRRLYELAFRPLLPLLGKTRRLYLAPDGKLDLVPFDALQDGRRSLLDAFDLSYLTSGKELLPRPEALPSSNSVVVFADPALGASPATRPSTGTPMHAPTPFTSLPKYIPPPRGEVDDMPWSPLPGTRQEARFIQHLIPEAQLYLGADATKERLLHLHAPAVLHLATHGFWLEDAHAPKGSRALGHVNTLSGTASELPLQAPMLRSGLVLANAGDSALASTGGRPHPEGAMVTAFELAGMDLWGTELVVLSACDTGRGDVALGQGIYGLRRAFAVAGAETLVMSLWQVNDDTTRLLMESYYRNLQAGQGRGEALRNAMRALRKTHPHPHDWAPFITLGRDTPLCSLGPRPS